MIPLSVQVTFDPDLERSQRFKYKVKSFLDLMIAKSQKLIANN